MQSLSRYLFIVPFTCMMQVQAQTVTSQVKLQHYALDEFSKGTVKMKSGETFEKLLNYNILTGEIIFDSGNGFLAISEPQNVDTVIIDGRTFVPVDKVFYEVLSHSGLPLLKEYTFTIKDAGTSIGYGMTTNTSAATALSDIKENGSAYNLKLPEGFAVIPGHNFWIRKEGKYYKVGNAQQLAKVFPGKKDRIKDFVKNNHTNFAKQEDVMAIVGQVQL